MREEPTINIECNHCLDQVTVYLNTDQSENEQLFLAGWIFFEEFDWDFCSDKCFKEYREGNWDTPLPPENGMSLYQFERIRPGDVLLISTTDIGTFVRLVRAVDENEGVTAEVFCYSGTNLSKHSPNFENHLKITKVVYGYKGDCPDCGKFDLVEGQDWRGCSGCSYIEYDSLAEEEL